MSPSVQRPPLRDAHFLADWRDMDLHNRYSLRWVVSAASYPLRAVRLRERRREDGVTWHHSTVGELRWLCCNAWLFSLETVQQFHCCGSDSYASWASSAFTSANQTFLSDGTTFSVPDSCCIDPQSQACRERRHLVTNDTDTGFIYTNVKFLKFICNVCSRDFFFETTGLSGQTEGHFRTIRFVRAFG